MLQAPIALEHFNGIAYKLPQQDALKKAGLCCPRSESFPTWSRQPRLGHWPPWLVRDLDHLHEDIGLKLCSVFHIFSSIFSAVSFWFSSAFFCGCSSAVSIWFFPAVSCSFSVRNEAAIQARRSLQPSSTAPSPKIFSTSRATQRSCAMGGKRRNACWFRKFQVKKFHCSVRQRQLCFASSLAVQCIMNPEARWAKNSRPHSQLLFAFTMTSPKPSQAEPFPPQTPPAAVGSTSSNPRAAWCCLWFTLHGGDKPMRI